MKYIFKFMFSSMIFALALTSCDSTMDDKVDIDAKYNKATAATVALTDAQAIDFQTISAICAVTNESEIIEQGIQIGTTDDFANSSFVANDTVVNSFEIATSGLSEQTTYYVRAYAVTRTAGTIVSEAKSITTPAAPQFSLDGKYNATEIDYNQDNGNWETADTYEVEVTIDAADPTKVYITNIWGGGKTIVGVYDEATGIIKVANEQIIYVHSSYGDVWANGLLSDLSDYSSEITFTFSAGKLVSTPMAAQCSAGTFGYFYMNMEQK